MKYNKAHLYCCGIVVIDEVSQETDAEMEKENDVVNVENEDVVGVEESCSPLTAAQAVWQRERKLALRKQEIAKCCDAILEDPEGHVCLLFNHVLLVL